MTEAQAEEYVRSHADDDELDSDDLIKVFSALAGRMPTRAEQEMLWSHCCAMVCCEDD